jgi:hypothetical protein
MHPKKQSQPLIQNQINGAQALGLWAVLLGSIASSMWMDSPTLIL